MIGRRPKQRGMILIVVLVVVVILALAAYTFSDLMLTHFEAVDLSGKRIQAKAAADSGVEATRLLLMQPKSARADLGGVYDNPGYFRGITVVDSLDPEDRANFTVVAAALDDQGYFAGMRYGLENESGRLNLNSLLLADQQEENGGRTLLMGVPGMTEDVADAIMDWLDPDDEPREFGCELEYYVGQSPPYSPKNGLFDTVDELLLVRGVTPQILYGLDINRNGAIDPSESGGQLGASIDNSLGDLDRGWSAYLTIYSAESNRNANGDFRVYVNNEDLQALYDELKLYLNENEATFIVAYRMSGAYSGSAAGEQTSGPLDLTKEGGTQIANVLELVNAKVQVRFEGAEENTILESPFSTEVGMRLQLPRLMDNCTVNPSPFLPGRISLNHASLPVLMGIPGMDEELASQILSTRSSFDPAVYDASREHETWLMTEGLLLNEDGEIDLDRMIELSPYVCAAGDAYRGQVIGYFQSGASASRLEVVISSAENDPRIVFWRDISRLGRGYPLEILGVDFLEEAVPTGNGF